MRKPTIQLQFIVVISVFLLFLNLCLGFMMYRHMGNALKLRIREHMLGTANSAAAMIDGDMYEKVTATNGDSMEYRHVFNVLSRFYTLSNLEYVYGIRCLGDGRFVFTVDPALVNAAVFGEEVVVTDALRKAFSGVASACDEPYTDDYGRFYSAYSPIRNSFGSVVGVVAVDCDAQWYDDQMMHVGLMVFVCCGVSLFIGAYIVMLFMRRLRKRFRLLNGEMLELAGEMDSFTRKVTGSPSREMASAPGDTGSLMELEQRSYDEIHELGDQIRHMRHDLQAHIDKVYFLAFRDPLTGVKSKQAYVEFEKMTDRMVRECLVQEFAVVVLDINGLKRMNDEFGHNHGDSLIRSASSCICDAFAHSPVFRIGGDEFVVILKGHDYAERFGILAAFNRLMEKNLREHGVVVAAGMAEYVKGQDTCLKDVFDRADSDMYRRKKVLKDLC